MSDEVAERGDGPSSLTDVWSRVTASLFRGAAAANLAVADALGDVTGMLPGSIETLAFEAPDWSFERSAETVDDLDVGDYVRFSKQISDDDVAAFARVSGDTNRLHLDDDYAAGTRFGRRIVHGSLAAAMVSAALARLPGVTIYLSEDLSFRRPVDVGDRLTARAEIVETLAEDRFRLEVGVTDGDEEVVDGEAVVLIDEPVEE